MEKLKPCPFCGEEAQNKENKSLMRMSSQGASERNEQK